MQNITFFLFFFFISLNTVCADPLFEGTRDLPVAYQGRFRSMDSTSRLWLYDTYHKQQLKNSDLIAFHATDNSAIDLLWKIHFLGHEPWGNSPLFWIHYATVKSLLQLEPTSDRFSYQQLQKNINENEKVNLEVVKLLIATEFTKAYQSFSNRSKSNLLELPNLAAGLWVIKENDQLIIKKTLESPPWHFLKAGTVISNSDNISIEKNTHDALLDLFQQIQVFSQYEGTKNAYQKKVEEFYEGLQKRNVSPNEIAQRLESAFPFTQRLQNAGTTLKMLPAKFAAGEWVSLHAFKTQVYDQKQNQLILSNNFTAFTHDHFILLRKAYFELEHVVLSKSTEHEIKIAAENFAYHYQTAYEGLAGQPYKQARGKELAYPSETRLYAETLYYRLPLIEITLLSYALALILMWISAKKTRVSKFALITLFFGFFIHTVVLAFRCYILQRPPVSNMFETVVYVPWIAVALGLVFYSITRSRVIIAAAVFASFGLLILLKLTQIDSRLENVQAVLDSQYWLIIHVLMVVGSYGAFVVSGILGHFYMADYLIHRKETERSEKIAHGILHTIYVGVALLIPGTILGGVWAAESWGRFWDWDPKESWAFISACVYLLFIHAYTFHHIRDFGLAIGSIVGLIAISFTWYGVNYVLGTGLHSYGFGSGGEVFYFLYVAIECLLILLVILLKNKTTSLLKKNE